MVTLDYRDKRPLYEQLTEKLRHLIATGALAAGEKLPSVRGLALDLSVNPNTVQRSYASLEADGYIYTVTGRGSCVSEPAHWRAGHLAAEEAVLKKALEDARDGGLSREDALRCVYEVYAPEGESKARSEAESKSEGRFAE